jgi:hypothetical protein
MDEILQQENKHSDYLFHLYNKNVTTRTELNTIVYKLPGKIIFII